MKYKAGDKVVIKTWEKMILEYSLNYKGNIFNKSDIRIDKKYFCTFNKEKVDSLCDKLVTIYKVNYDFYDILEDKRFAVSEWMIDSDKTEKCKIIREQFNEIDRGFRFGK